MEKEIIETVLSEILEEIKIIHTENNTKENHVEKLIIKIQFWEEKILLAKNKTPEINLLPLQMELEKSEKRLEQIIITQPKNVIHKKQILLFPETGAREYYRIVFGRFFFWMMMFLLASYLFALGKQFINNWKQVEERQYEIIKLQSVIPNHLKDHQKKR